MDHSDLLISVIICTYNRADLLVTALKSLSKQTMDSGRFEVLVVDNNSNDKTPEVAADFCRRYSNIRYFLEPAQGLSHARNCGWQKAKGAYVAYIDDECTAPVHWLSTAEKIIHQKAPILFGGPYYGYYTYPSPRWWKESYESYAHSATARPLTPGEYLRGANFFIQRELYDRTGGFDVTLGMCGNKINYGEEAELQKRISETMPEKLIYYDPELFVYHLVRPEKMKTRYIVSSRFTSGRHIYRIFYDRDRKPSVLLPLYLLAQTAIQLIRFSASFLMALVRPDRTKYPYLQNYLYERTFEHLRTLGTLYERYLHLRLS